MACIFGDVTKIQPTGASERTEVEASYKLAEHDLKKMDQYKSIIIKVARAKQMDPAVIAGIISRESRAGALLVNGWGDNGNGFGLMQFTGGSEKLDTDWKTILTIQQVPLNKRVINQFDDVDKRHHTPRGAWNSEEHVTQGTEILIQSIQAIQKKFPSWPKEHQFKGGLAAYNFGPGNVRTYDGMDIGTSGGDYSNDVAARSQWFKRHGY